MKPKQIEIRPRLSRYHIIRLLNCLRLDVGAVQLAFTPVEKGNRSGRHMAIEKRPVHYSLQHSFDNKTKLAHNRVPLVVHALQQATVMALLIAGIKA
jgi:hypothetical protein